MVKPRLPYLLLIFLIIIAGLASRKISIIPLFVGDILWAMMVYFIFRFLLIAATIKKIAVCSLIFSYAIECSQLYQEPWINQIRHTLPGKLILGQGFLWGDLLAYTVGIALCAWAEHAFKKRRTISN